MAERIPREDSLRRVHGVRIVGFTYGQRALLMQAMDPLAFAGLIANTAGLRAPFARLAHTAELMETVKVASLEQITSALFEVGGSYRRSM